MSKSARRLGRGLDSLVPHMRRSAGDPTADLASDKALGMLESTADTGGPIQALMMPVDSLDPNPFQPRDNISSDTVLSLAASIRQSGMLQPIAVRIVSGRHEIIAGERRWRAAKSIGMSEVPVIVHRATDEQMLELALIENIQREDLNAIERARAYLAFGSRFGRKPAEVAARLGEDRTTVVNYLRLLDLPDSVQALVANGKLSMGHARCLLGLSGEPDRLRLAESAVANQLSVRALEEIVRRKKTRGDGQEPSPAPQPIDPRRAHLRDLQQRFEEAVKTKVTIHEGRRKGSGRIVIEYYSLEDFDRIASRLNVSLE